MDYSARSGNPVTLGTPCLVIGVFEGGTLTGVATAVDEATDDHLGAVIKLGDFSGRLGETLLQHQVPGIAAHRLLLVGLGKQEGYNLDRLRSAARGMQSALARTKAENALVTLPGEQTVGEDALDVRARVVVEAVADAAYRFDEMKSKSKPEKPRGPVKLELHGANRSDMAALRRGIAIGAAIGNGITLARDLGNRPGNVCTPRYMAEQGQLLAKNFSRVTTKVLDEKAMKKLGMGALLAVSQGSAEPARLVIMEYNGGRKGDKPHVLVGKGISFDAGGISLKPAAGMGEMKFDMCGAASVFGVMQAVATMKLPVNVVGVVAAAENMPSGTAVKPGDIVTTMSGQTVEINNTDAEGRLVLCDALTYIERYKPATVIDIATLTGACVIALGHHATALIANDDELADHLLAAGDATRDRAWRLPLWKEYQKQIDSNHADMSNVGGRPAGTITAACYLARFAGDYRWAHLDIAGTAWTPGAQKCATGRPVAQLTQYLMDRAAS